MVDVFEDTLNIGAGCPSDIAVNTNTRFQGTVDYHLVNRGDEDGFISILVTLIDSAGNNMQFSSSLQQVPAGGDFTDSHLLFLDASYDTPRQINVTMRIEFSGALSDVKFAECSFNVTGGQPSPLAWIIHEPGGVILSGAPAKNFRPASFAGRAGAESKDPYSRKKSQCGRVAQQQVWDCW